jgi:hypothetical protein
MSVPLRERVDDAELVAYIVNNLVLGLTCASVVHWGFVFRVSGCRIADPLALRPMCGMIVVIVIGESLRNAIT